jgi:hypothetical protein
MSQYRIKRRTGKREHMAIVNNGGETAVGLKVYSDGYAIRVGSEESDTADYGEELVWECGGKTYSAHVDQEEGEGGEIVNLLPSGWVTVDTDAEPEEDGDGDGDGDGGDDGEGEEVEVEVEGEQAA